MGRMGGDGAWPLVAPDDTSALQFLASCVAAAQDTVSTLRGGRQPITSGWLYWVRTRRGALGEMAAAACSSGGAVFEGPRHPHAVGAPACLLLELIETSFRAFDVACGALISAQPAAAHDGHDVPASPLGPGSLVGLAAQRTAFSLLTGVALGTT